MKLQITSVSRLMQGIDGPISGDIRNEIIRLAELVCDLPDEKWREGRAVVLSLADACLRVQGLENTDLLGPEGAA